MVEYSCDNSKTEKALRHLVETVRQQGGIVHDQLIIGSSKGDLIVRAPGNIDAGESIIILPEEALLPVKKFTIEADGEKLILKGHDKKLSTGQVELMKAVLAVYNLTAKFKDHRKTSTILNWREGDALFEHLEKGRTKLFFLEELDQLHDDAYAVNDFLKTRTFGFLQKPEEKTSGTPQKEKADNPNLQHTAVIIPVADFLNHHSKSPEFQVNFDLLTDKSKKTNKQPQAEGYDGVAAIKSCPIAESDECFVFYVPQDALDTFFHYNFVESHASFVRSVPVTIQLPGLGTLEIKSTNHVVRDESLPEQIRDLFFYVPPIIVDKDNNIVWLRYAYISQPTAPQALRRILNWALNEIWPDLSDKDRFDYILRAEKQIICANLAYYTELENILKTYKADPGLKTIVQNAKDVAKVQLEKIRNYPFFAATQT